LPGGHPVKLESFHHAGASQPMETLRDHPARESLLWLRRMRDLAAERPSEFTKVILPTEKKFLEQVLESSLGASRKKAATKKTTAKKTAARPKVRPKGRI
jgi:hypothetical protein